MLDAQEYLAKVLPWPQDGDPPAHINLHWSLDKMGNNGKPIWTGRATHSVQEAVKTVKWALSLADVKDIYVCMSSQKDALPKISKGGHRYLLPIRGTANAVALKSLYMDIDAKGKDKDSYDTLAEALVAFNDFITDVGLPRPNVIVKTGGGFHVYWTFERALTIPEWQPLSNALAAAAKAHGLKCDTGCTVDAARILRIPGTFNRKLDVRRPVVLAGGRTGGDYLLARLERSLDPYKTLTPKVTPAAPPAWTAVLPQLTPITGGNDLSAGIEKNSGPPIDIKDVANECPFIREALTTGGKDFGNPLWNLSTLIATFTEGGRADAHAMANGHTTYSTEETDALYDRKERDRKSKDLGWPACRTISLSGSGVCQSCSHLAANRSPLNFATAQPAAAGGAAANAPGGAGASTGQFSPLPDGYSQSPDGVVSQLLTQEDGSQLSEPICRYALFDGYLETYPDWTLNFSTHLETGKTTRISGFTEHLTDKTSMSRCLSRQGIALHDSESKRVREFFVSWIKTLQESKMVVGSVPYGWSTDSKSNIEGFVYGGNLWMANGNTRQASNPDKVLAMRYTPRGGGKTSWVAAAKLITDQKRPALDAIVASAFAAPLIKFCYEPGILMSTYSTKSGIGKTSALKVAQAVWGDPIRAMQALDDTQNAVFKKIGAIRNLPMYWDELKTEEDTKRFTNLVFKLTNQKEKDRLTQTAAMRDGGSWNTMLVCASNDSLMQFVVQQSKQTTAGINRIFEYEVPAAVDNTGQIDQADASRILGRLNDNYGHVGEEYAGYLGSNHVAIAKDVEDFYKSIGNEINSSNEERYWRVMLACLIKGAEYANKLGFTNIGVPSLKAFLIGVVGNLRAEKGISPVDLEQVINVSNALEQFLSDHRFRHTLYTNKIHRKKGRPVPGDIEIKRDIARLEKVRVHVALDDRVLHIDKSYLQEWLIRNKHPCGAIMKALAAKFKAKDIQASMAAGTDFSGGRMYMIEIDLLQNPTLNFIDGT